MSYTDQLRIPAWREVEDDGAEDFKVDASLGDIMRPGLKVNKGQA